MSSSTKGKDRKKHFFFLVLLFSFFLLFTPIPPLIPSLPRPPSHALPTPFAAKYRKRRGEREREGRNR